MIRGYGIRNSVNTCGWRKQQSAAAKAHSGGAYQETLRVANSHKIQRKTPTPHPNRIVGFFLGRNY
jgi:hypothetical protein